MASRSMAPKAARRARRPMRPMPLMPTFMTRIPWVDISLIVELLTEKMKEM
jgi:hypothetical protein